MTGGHYFVLYSYLVLWATISLPTATVFGILSSVLGLVVSLLSPDAGHR